MVLKSQPRLEEVLWIIETFLRPACIELSSCLDIFQFPDGSVVSCVCLACTGIVRTLLAPPELEAELLNSDTSCLAIRTVLL